MKRATYNLTPRAEASLAHICELSQDNQTDVVCRSLVRNDFIETTLNNGGSIFVKYGDEDPKEIIFL